jgi:hypothetical protein
MIIIDDIIRMLIVSAYKGMRLDNNSFTIMNQTGGTMHHPQKLSSSSAAMFFKCSCIICLFSLTAASGIAVQKTVREAIAAGEPTIAVVETSSNSDATIYSIADGDCTIKWIVYTTELNMGVVKHAARCQATLTRQLPLLSRILEVFLSKDRNAPSFHTLFWGGMVPDTGPASLELPLRLALAAHRSRGWNSKRGRPVRGDLNGFVKVLANQGPIYPELITLFERFHRSISIASVEKVRVLEAKNLPFYDQLKKQGVRATDKLPFDCMVWFFVTEEVH